ncbi:hypothetical protein D3C84_1211290 [compost metagenome]
MFVVQVQLPENASSERNEEVLTAVREYFAEEEHDSVASSFTITDQHSDLQRRTSAGKS